jgi:soluble lytic murein transglycosylase
VYINKQLTVWREKPLMPQRLLQFCILLSIFLSTGAFTATLDDHRRDYQLAKKALRAGKIQSFLELANTLKDYPLYPYLRYDYLQPRLDKTNNGEIHEFLAHYPDFPQADDLRARWLKQLARNRDWQAYFENYAPQKDPVLQCNYLIARINTGNRNMLVEDGRSIWLTGSSLPPDCNPVIDYLKKNDQMTNDLVWQRFGLAMQQNNTGLARYLRTYLDEKYRHWADLWLAMYANPGREIGNSQVEDTPITREIMGYGIRRLARLNLNKAIEYWDDVQQRFSFTPGERSEIDRTLAVRAAEKNHPRAVELLDRVENFYVDDDVFHWRLITCLTDNDWERLRRWTEGVPDDEDMKYRWMYWHARALEQTGYMEKASQIYTAISGKRDYYGFLAADRINSSYNMEHKPLPDNPEDKQKIIAMPGIQRAQELREIGDKRLARREWNFALSHMTSYQQEIAAGLAADWGWYGEAILTMGHAHTYDDLEVRFPIPYESLINENAAKQQLDQGWVYALVRSESAFIEDASSPAGALGLMQVMPRTGKLTARSMGIKHFRAAHLLEAEKNVPIGSAYLKQMLDLFGGNMILATAAYNAGPQRVKSWLPKNDCMEPDVWVEKIPFTETRKYVRRVMFFSSIYDWRLHHSVIPLNQRMATVSAGNNTMLAQLSCSGGQVSYN